MSTEEKSTTDKSKDDDDELDRRARQILLDEAKRNKIRAETQGALGWQKPNLTTNRKFLRNTLISNAVHNIHKNEQEQRRRRKSLTERKHDDYQHSRKRSRTSPPHADDDERSSKRKK